MCLKRLHHFSRCCEIWNNEELSYLDVKKCYPTTLSISLHREPYIPVFHFISYLADRQIQTVKGNIFRGVFWDMKGWWAELCSRKILSYYTQNSHLNVFCKEDFLEIFTKFTGKHRCCILSLPLHREPYTHVFHFISCKYGKI